MEERPLDAFMAAVRSTRIHRSRKNYLFTFGNTKLPYRIVAESSINEKSSIIRSGEVIVDKPQILFTSDPTSFDGFVAEGNHADLDSIKYALLSRGINFPQMNYKNNTDSLEVVSELPNVIIDRFMNQFEDQNDSKTALIQCREDLWNLALLHYVLGEVIRSSSSNMQEYLERYPLG